MAKVVLTGEGCFDRQTSLGKGPGGLARLARENGTPVMMFTGSMRRWDGPELPLFHEVVELVAPASSGTPAAKVLCETAARWAAARLKGR